MGRVVIFWLIFCFSFSILAQPLPKKEKMLGNIIKNALETYHYRKQKIDDQLSQKAFDQFIKKLDYGKQFLLKSDIDKLRKFQFRMDDEIVTGEYKLVDQSIEIFRKRVKEAESYRQKYFKQHFTFKAKESIENDPDKREFSENREDLMDLWRKTFKQATLSRYLTLVENQADDEKDQKKDKRKNKKKGKKDKKKKVVTKKEKKLTPKEMMAKAHSKTSEKYKRIFSRIVEEKRDEYFEKYYNAIAAIFDPHTSYMPPKRKEDFDIDISGSLEGIGAVLQEDGAFIKVVKIVPGGAAWRQKELEVGDIILYVAQGKSTETVDLEEMKVDDAVRYIRGKKGTAVRLTVKKEDKSRKEIIIIRDVVEIGASFAKSSVLEHKKLKIKVGYIYVPKFYRDFGNEDKNCTKDVKAELNRLKKHNVVGMILDLRNNGGGALEDAKQMSGLFISEGPIVQIKNHDGQIDVLKDTDTSITWDGPLIVLINRYSASASEILAGALQDYRRAVIVGGEFSHGKGTVQAVLNLNQGTLLSRFWPKMGALKVTIQTFYRIIGISTQYRGITPDIILPDPLSYADNREQDLDYSLPFDTVNPLKFVPWNKIKYHLPILKKRSARRVAKSEHYKKINEIIKYRKKRKDDTIVSLNMQEVQSEDKKNRAMAEKMKYEKENMDIVVTNYEASLRSHEKIVPGDEKKWREDFDQRKEAWVKSLRLNAGIEESLFILDDILRGQKGQKLTMLGD